MCYNDRRKKNEKLHIKILCAPLQQKAIRKQKYYYIAHGNINSYHLCVCLNMNTEHEIWMHTYVCMHWVWAIRYYFTWSILLQAMTHLIIFLSIFVVALFRHICVCSVIEVCFFLLLFIYLLRCFLFHFWLLLFLSSGFILLNKFEYDVEGSIFSLDIFSLLSMCINNFLFLHSVHWMLYVPC